MAVLKKLISTVSHLDRCGGLDSPGFISFYFGKVLQSRKILNLTVSTLQGCGGLKRTGFNNFASLWS